MARAAAILVGAVLGVGGVLGLGGPSSGAPGPGPAARAIEGPEDNYLCIPEATYQRILIIECTGSYLSDPEVRPGGVAGSVAADLPIPQSDPARARRIADDVLARPEYRVPSPSLVERVQRWVADVVARVFGALIGGGGASVIAWGVLAVAIGVVGFLVARFARGVTPDAGRPTTSTSVQLRTATDWRAEADAHERAGRWRPALRCRYRALVADLAAGGLVEEVPGRTAGEYRAAVTVAAPDVASDFAAVTELFERAWYGRVPTGADDAAHLSSLADRVLAGAR